MNTCHPFSVLHLQLEGGVAIAKKPNESAPYSSSAFYQSPKAVGSLEAALAKFLDGAPREQVYINLVPEFASLQSFSDSTLTSDKDTLGKILEDATGKSTSDCNLRLLDAVTGQPHSGNAPLLVSMLEKAKVDKALEMAKNLGFKNASVFNSTLTTIAGLQQWRNASGNSENVAILEVGMEESQVTINTTQGLIFSRTIPVSLKKIAATIQEELKLKFDSAALMLFFNGIFDFTRISPKIAAAVSEELKPALQTLCEKHKCKVDRLLVSSLPPSFTWLNKTFSEACELKEIPSDELGFLENREDMGDTGKNPAFLAPTLLAHAKKEDIPWLADHQEGAEASAAAAPVVAPVPVVEPKAEETPAPEAPKKEEPKPQEEPKVNEAPKTEEKPKTEEASKPVEKAEDSKPVEAKKETISEPAKPVEKKEEPKEAENPAPAEVKSEEYKQEQAGDDNAQAPGSRKNRRRKGKKGKNRNQPIITPPKEEPVKAKQEEKPADSKPVQQEKQKEEVQPAAKKEADKRPAPVTPIPQEEDDKKKKIIIFGGIAAAAVIGIGLIFALGGGDDTSPTPTPTVASTSAPESTEVIDSELNIASDDDAANPVIDTEDTEASDNDLLASSDSATDSEGSSGIDAGLEVAASNANAELDLNIEDSATNEVAEASSEDPGIIINGIDEESVDEEPVDEEPEPVVNEVLYGGIRLVSSPIGAEVRMNGRTVGVTPMNIDGLEFGQYDFEIVKEPYLSEALTITVDSEEIVELPSIDLELPAGNVVVNTWPEGVAFDLIPVDALDDQSYSGVTPANFADVMKGDYKVVFHRDHWEDVTQELSVLFKETANVNYNYPQGSLEITSTPSGATVYANGERLGLTPLTLDEIKAGTMELSFRLANHEDAFTTVDVNAQDKNFAHQKLLSFDRIVSFKELDVPPVSQRGNRLSNLQRAARGSNKFEIELVVGKDGQPEDINIITSTNLDLHKELIKDLEDWRFQPAVRKGHVVRTKVRIPIILGNPDDLPESIDVAQVEQEEE